jgi:hypothetical protein
VLALILAAAVPPLVIALGVVALVVLVVIAIRLGWMRTEPAALIGFVGAVLSAGAAFGLDLTDTQSKTLMVVVTLLVGLVLHPIVTSPATASKLLDKVQTHKHDAQVARIAADEQRQNAIDARREQSRLQAEVQNLTAKPPRPVPVKRARAKAATRAKETPRSKR